MKKFAVFIALIAAALLFSGGGFIPATLFTGGGYSVYTDSLPTEEYDLSPLSAYIKLLTESEQSAAVRFYSASDAEKLVKILNAEKKGEEIFPSLTVTTYYTPYLRRCKTVGGERVNLQIAVDDGGTVTAGTPLLSGSY